MKKLKIFKFTVPSIPGKYTFDLELGYKILSCADQNGNITLWYLCDPDNLKGTEGSIRSVATVLVAYTGTTPIDPLDAQMPFIGTVQIGGLVYHIFAS